MANKWQDLRAATITTPEADARVEQYRKIMLLEGALAGLRERLGISQRTLATRLGTSQPNIHRIEHEDDPQLSTLWRYVTACGGRLQVRVVLDDTEIIIADDVGEPIGS